jgi:hypothetical protein
MSDAEQRAATMLKREMRSMNMSSPSVPTCADNSFLGRWFPGAFAGPGTGLREEIRVFNVAGLNPMEEH